MSNGSWQNRLLAWMQGRNGSDELGVAAVAASLVLLLANTLFKAQWLALPALCLAVYSCWRTASRDLAHRRAENAAFLKVVGPAASWLRHPRERAQELRTYKHLSCPACGKRVRVPRGKGKIRVTCPACHEKFEAKS